MNNRSLIILTQNNLFGDAAYGTCEVNKVGAWLEIIEGINDVVGAINNIVVLNGGHDLAGNVCDIDIGDKYILQIKTNMQLVRRPVWNDQ